MTMYEINSQIADRKRGWGVEPYGQKKCFFALPCSIAQITHHALTHWLLGNIVFYFDIKNNTLCVLPMSKAKKTPSQMDVAPWMKNSWWMDDWDGELVIQVVCWKNPQK